MTERFTRVPDGVARALRALALLSTVLVALGSAACSSPAPHTSTAPMASAAVLATTAPIPAQLQGTWEPTVAVTGSGPLLLNLVFSTHSFAFYDDDITAGAIGRAWAEGPNRIVLGIRGGCDTPGTYTWAITNGQLTLTGGADDDCPRRTPLTSRVWKKVSDSTKPADTDATQ